MKLTHLILSAALVPGFAACKKDIEEDREANTIEQESYETGRTGAAADNSLERAGDRSAEQWREEQAALQRTTDLDEPGQHTDVEAADDLEDGDLEDQIEEEESALEILRKREAAPVTTEQPKSDDATGGSGASRGVEEGAHATPAQHGYTLTDETDETDIELVPISDQTKKAKPITAKAKVIPRGNKEAQIIVDVSNLKPGQYSVRMGGDCPRDYGVASEDYPAAAPDKPAHATTQLGMLQVGANGQGRLIATVPTDPSWHKADPAEMDQQAVSVVPKKGEASEPVACGMVSIPEGEGRG